MNQKSYIYTKRGELLEIPVDKYSHADEFLKNPSKYGIPYDALKEWCNNSLVIQEETKKYILNKKKSNITLNPDENSELTKIGVFFGNIRIRTVSYEEKHIKKLAYFEYFGLSGKKQLESLLLTHPNLWMGSHIEIYDDETRKFNEFDDLKMIFF